MPDCRTARRSANPLGVPSYSLGSAKAVQNPLTKAPAAQFTWPRKFRRTSPPGRRARRHVRYAVRRGGGRRRGGGLRRAGGSGGRRHPGIGGRGRLIDSRPRNWGRAARGPGTRRRRSSGEPAPARNLVIGCILTNRVCRAGLESPDGIRCRRTWECLSRLAQEERKHQRGQHGGGDQDEGPVFLQARTSRWKRPPAGWA